MCAPAPSGEWGLPQESECAGSRLESGWRGSCGECGEGALPAHSLPSPFHLVCWGGPCSPLHVGRPGPWAGVPKAIFPAPYVLWPCYPQKEDRFGVECLTLGSWTWEDVEGESMEGEETPGKQSRWGCWDAGGWFQRAGRCRPRSGDTSGTADTCNYQRAGLRLKPLLISEPHRWGGWLFPQRELHCGCTSTCRTLLGSGT